jgi:hypothetical protein
MSSVLKMLHKIRLATFVSVLFGAVAAILVAATPHAMFQNLVSATGLPSVLPAAAPPLGDKAKILAIIFSGLATMAGLWLTLTPLSSMIRPKHTAEAMLDDDAEGLPSPRLRRADTHPDTPARRPIFADQELGTPLMSDELVLDAPVLEAEIEAPLATPEALAAPVAEPEATTKIEPVVVEPVVAEVPEPIAEPKKPTKADAKQDADDDSISGMMRRLEGGLNRRGMGGSSQPYAAEPAPTLAADIEDPHIDPIALIALKRLSGQS